MRRICGRRLLQLTGTPCIDSTIWGTCHRKVKWESQSADEWWKMFWRVKAARDAAVSLGRVLLAAWSSISFSYTEWVCSSFTPTRLKGRGDEAAVGWHAKCNAHAHTQTHTHTRLNSFVWDLAGSSVWHCSSPLLIRMGPCDVCFSSAYISCFLIPCLTCFTQSPCSDAAQWQICFY